MKWERISTEAKQAVRDSIYKKVNEFLQRRENNGKTICLDSFAPDGKTMQHAVEIVDVPQLTNSRDLKRGVVRNLKRGVLCHRGSPFFDWKHTRK